MKGIISEVLDSLDAVIGRVGLQVSEGSAQEVAGAIFRGMRISREMYLSELKIPMGRAAQRESVPIVQNGSRYSMGPLEEEDAE